MQFVCSLFSLPHTHVYIVLDGHILGKSIFMYVAIDRVCIIETVGCRCHDHVCTNSYTPPSYICWMSVCLLDTHTSVYSTIQAYITEKHACMHVAVLCIIDRSRDCIIGLVGCRHRCHACKFLHPTSIHIMLDVLLIKFFVSAFSP